MNAWADQTRMTRDLAPERLMPQSDVWFRFMRKQTASHCVPWYEGHHVVLYLRYTTTCVCM